MRTPACILALMAVAAVRADVPDSALFGVFGTCTLQRSALVDVEPGACAAVVDKLKKCTARLQLTRNATMTATPLVSVMNRPYGSTESSVVFEDNFSHMSSAVLDADCNGFFDMSGNSGNDNQSPGALSYARAGIIRTTCPVSSFLYGSTELVAAQSKFLPPLGSSPAGSTAYMSVEFGDVYGADVDVSVELRTYVASGTYYRSDRSCRAQYEVVSGSCMFAGQSGTPPTCGSGGGGASASMALPSVGVGALLVLSLLAVAVVGMTGLAAMR